jgi:PKD repeat protein
MTTKSAFLAAVILFCCTLLFISNVYSQSSCDADFYGKPTSGCAPLTVTFTSTSVGAAKWTWSFPGGLPSSASGPGPHKVVYNNPGNYTVSLNILCKVGGSTETKKNYITVTDCQCAADFYAKPTSGCAKLEVTYTDNSVNAVSWNWAFPGGTPSSATGKGPHKVIYYSPGGYDAELSIQCKNGTDLEKKYNYIKVGDCACEADFKGEPTSGAAPLKVKFTDKSTNATSWKWSFPGGTPSSAQTKGPHDVTYKNAGVYDAKLEVSCGQKTDIMIRDKYIRVDVPLPTHDYGDAPEGVIAYPATGVIGNFPTCKGVGPAGYIEHGGNHDTFLGNHSDFEDDGNEGNCPVFSGIYDQDESCYESDAGLWSPDAYTIVDSSGILLVKLLCEEFEGKALGYTCSMAKWGENINLWYDTHYEEGAYINVLIDWNQDGSWGGSSRCGEGDDLVFAPEHAMKNYWVPGAANGLISSFNPPDFKIGPKSGFVWARFTITNDPIPLPWDGSGSFDEGETEDYLIRIEEEPDTFDFGDVPYATLLADNGARHRVIQGYCLGTLIDGEDDGQPDPEAMGDDNHGIDDEDGVIFKTDLASGEPATLDIIASKGGMLKAWIDYNQDNDWDDPGEMVLDQQVAEGTNTETITIPADAKEGYTFARFRYSSHPIESDRKLLEDGEVEDYHVHIKVLRYDFGDAPASFPTTLAQNGAYHLLSDLYLGNKIDWETDGANSVMADADDIRGSDDEDGVVFIPPFVPGYPYEVQITPSDSGYFSAWIDYNHNGIWDEWDDVLFRDVSVGPRFDHPELPNMRSRTLPADIPMGNAAVRVRFSRYPGLDYFGYGGEGEVEDYLLNVGEGMDVLDWGDAPDPPYPTLAVNDGPRHVLDFHHGFGLQDSEPDGQPNAQANNDDLHGENDESEHEIGFPTAFLPGDSARIAIWPNDHIFVNAWIDFNADGDWDDEYEHCIVDREMWNPGHPDTVSVFVPPYTVAGTSYARFRGSFDPGIGYTGLAIFGEVQDHKVILGNIASCELDSLALVALYNSTNGPGWTLHHNWLTGKIATWFGVTMSGCRVQGLDLDSNNLTGTLPPEIGNLTALASLDLRYNNLSGTIPAELGNLQACKYLYLTHNGLTGPIPSQVGQLLNLVEMDINRCQLEGAIPPEIGHLTQLEILDLSSNNLEGEIPVEMCSLPKLREIRLHYNHMSGPIPKEINGLVSLENLTLFNNSFSGPLPEELYELTNLQVLNLWGNGFSGSMSPDIGNLVDLQVLSFSENDFTGPIPPEFYSLTQLTDVALGGNQFNGTISPLIGNLVNLLQIRFNQNRFSGAIPAEIASLPYLLVLTLSKNQFTVLPDLSPMDSLNTLSIAENQFSFEDIEPNIHIADFTYSPQDSIGEAQDTTVTVGSGLKLYAFTGGSANHYSWIHNGTAIPDNDTPVLPIPSVSLTDSGSYTCAITNTIATDLTLYRRIIHVHVDDGADVQKNEQIPLKFTLVQNYPNPFNPTTTLHFELPEACDVRLVIYDVSGRQVRTLVDAYHQPGVYSSIWDANDEGGMPVAAGLYFCRMEAGEFVKVIKLAFVK